jgi:hypothetical protein
MVKKQRHLLYEVEVSKGLKIFEKIFLFSFLSQFLGKNKQPIKFQKRNLTHELTG